MTAVLPAAPAPAADPFRAAYLRARAAALGGDYDRAEGELARLLEQAPDAEHQAHLLNDRGCLAALQGDALRAADWFAAAQQAALDGRLAAENAAKLVSLSPPRAAGTGAPPRIAILSLLFNWPSTGGGTVHTVEAGVQLVRAGCTVQHFFARHAPWGTGRLEGTPPVPSTPLEFTAYDWNAAAIQQRFRAAVAEFDPDLVLVTGSWSFKPLLAEAAGERPYILRFGAQECLCPLNNVRLLFDRHGAPLQCENDQLRDPEQCRACVAERGAQSGVLHQAERRLAGFGAAAYLPRLRRALQRARAVFAVNPEIAARLAPFAPAVQVVPSGFDPARFPPPGEPPPRRPGAPQQILFAGLVDEPMKGFRVLHRACASLWERRRDFELVATAAPETVAGPFTRGIGWQSQEDLPSALAAADIVAFPTIAQEALGRSAVEAMGCARPVVASRIGGLAWVVEHERTGLLCTPGDPDDLARQLERLLDDEPLRRRLGAAGRAKFEREFTWDVVFERCYRPVLDAVLQRTEVP